MSEALEVIRDDKELARPSASDPESIVRYALDHGASVDVIERMMAIRRELNAENAKREFETALAAFQSECPVIVKEKGVPDRAGNICYKYAPFEAIAAQIRPYLQKHGFNYTFDTDIKSEPGWVVVVCNVTHKAGHTRASTAKFPLGTKTAIMSDTQQFSAALTFANRRCLQNAFGLVVAGEDMDGMSGKLKPKGPSAMEPPQSGLKALAKELWDLLKDVRGTEKNWNQANQWLWRQEILDGAVPENAPELSEKRFKDVIEKAKAKLK
jgi:hypothetical protein